MQTNIYSEVYSIDMNCLACGKQTGGLRYHHGCFEVTVEWEN